MFIVIEGIGGSGKTSVLNGLKRKHRDWYFSEEPCAKTHFGSLARAAVNGDCKAFVTPWAQMAGKRGLLHLMDLGRYEHLAMIEDRLISDLNDWDLSMVVFDRYTASTLVYQSELWSERLLKEICSKHRAPDLGILLDCEPGIAASRLDEDDKYDRQNIDERRRKYLALFHTAPNDSLGRLCGTRRIIINTSRMPLERVVSLVEGAILTVKIS